MKYSKSFMLSALLSFILTSLQAQLQTKPGQQPEELGQVSWYRDYQTATQQAKEQGKSVLILFQEVPGCSTCRNYGHNILSHPLLVEAIENEFIPLAIYNNKGGKDREILEKYGEPSWNNPVVRIVDPNGKNLVKRVSGNYAALGLFNAMNTVLKKTNGAVPDYMQLLGEELAGQQNAQEKYFKMYCFWSGEKHLGQANGVIATEPGFMGGSEVVKVTYDASKINPYQLDAHAEKASCQPVKETGNYRVAQKDEQYYLKQTNYKYLPLSDLQKTKINSALGSQQSALKYLSPKQLDWLKALENPKTIREVRYHQDFVMAWKLMSN